MVRKCWCPFLKNTETVKWNIWILWHFASWKNSWCPMGQWCFHLHHKAARQANNQKRHFITFIYDPLVFLSPVMLPAKLLLKGLCKEQHGWDKDIDEKMQKFGGNGRICSSPTSVWVDVQSLQVLDALWLLSCTIFQMLQIMHMALCLICCWKMNKAKSIARFSLENKSCSAQANHNSKAWADCSSGFSKDGQVIATRTSCSTATITFLDRQHYEGHRQWNILL